MLTIGWLALYLEARISGVSLFVLALPPQSSKLDSSYLRATAIEARTYYIIRMRLHTLLRSLIHFVIFTTSFQKSGVENACSLPQIRKPCTFSKSVLSFKLSYKHNLLLQQGSWDAIFWNGSRDSRCMRKQPVAHSVVNSSLTLHWCLYRAVHRFWKPLRFMMNLLGLSCTKKLHRTIGDCPSLPSKAIFFCCSVPSCLKSSANDQCSLNNSKQVTVIEWPPLKLCPTWLWYQKSCAGNWESRLVSL